MAGVGHHFTDSLTSFPSISVVNNPTQFHHANGLISVGEGVPPVFPMHTQSSHDGYTVPGAGTVPTFPFQSVSVRNVTTTAWEDGGSDSIPPPYSSPAAVFAILITFSVCTIFGNSLVMVAVAKEHYLKSPPNYFVASLAAADFSVGVLLVPFEAITQLLNRKWIFGEIYCDLFHAFDVLLTTASILNLCCISLDRYWAICTPLHYCNKMSTQRASRFIILIWICSILISFPAIFWWRSLRDGPVPYGQCPFTDNVVYLVTSSCISFYIPLSVMLFAYYKIYLAAVKQSKSIQQGTKHFSSNDKSHDKNRTGITLRIHRGGSTTGGTGMGSVGASSAASHSNTLPATSASNRNGTGDGLPFRQSFTLGRSDPSGVTLLNESKRTSSEKIGVGRSGILKVGNTVFKRRYTSGKRKAKRTFSDSIIQSEEISSNSTGSNGGIANSNADDGSTGGGGGLFPPILDDDERSEASTGGGGAGSSALVRLITEPLVIMTNVTTQTSPAETPKTNGKSKHGSRNSSNNHIIPGISFRRQSRRSFTVARKLAKFAKEKKAAKTLAIVLGVFIICWLPFFIINIVFAFCKSCAEGQMKIFEVVTWLGWINSAMNPVIYACWSHDFRRAFARLLCCKRCDGRDRQWRLQRQLSVA